MRRDRSDADATQVMARSTAAEPEAVKLTWVSGHRDDEAEGLEQLLAEVVVESRRHPAECAQLTDDRVADAWVVVSQQRRPAVRGEVQEPAVLVIPDVRAVASNEPQVA